MSASASAPPPRSTTTSLDVSQLPSVKDGISPKEEAEKRRKTCRFIEEAGRILKLPRVAVATAMVFFHRFYAKHSFNEHDRFEVAVACLLLAAKTEESPKKLDKVIVECHQLKHRGMAAGRISQTSPNHPTSSSASSSGTLDPKGEEFMKLKERILLLERVILHTIGFELSIDHPYKFLVDQIKKLIQTRQIEYITPPSGSSSSQVMNKMMNELVQYSMNFANDSMHTSLCLQFPASSIATSCIYLGAQFAKVRPVGDKTWLEVFGYPDVEDFASICVQIMELIVDKKGADMEAFKKIRADLEQIRAQPAPGAKHAAAAAGPSRDAKRPRTD